MKNFILAYVSGILLLAGIIIPGHQAEALDSQTEYLRRATVKILTVYTRPDYNSPWKISSPQNKTGSGVIISNNLILTNAHVVSDATSIQVQKENDPELYSAKVLHIGHECDLALLVVDEGSFFKGTSTLGFGAIPELRSKVTTYGYPQGGERISITEGIVSRIEIGTYSHSSRASFLRIQTDAALNPGNSGGPVIQEGKIVGIAFQTQNKSDNIGFMIPVPVIGHFLNDVKDGTYNGFPDIGIFSQNLMSQTFRKYLKMPEAASGVQVTHVIPGSSADGTLKKGDILTVVESFDIANDGSIMNGRGRLNYSYVVNQKQVGEKLKIVFLRNGEKKQATLTMNLFPEKIKWFNEYETRPEYYIFGGIIFQPLSKEYLKTWKKWWYNGDQRMLYYFYYHLSDNVYPDRKEYVVINRILPDKANTYISNIREAVVREINGIQIKRLDDVIKAFKSPKEGYHEIYVDGSKYKILLKASQMQEANQRIIQNYRIPSLKRLNKNRKTR